MSALSRMANLFRRRALDADLDSELKFHLDMRVNRNLQRGLNTAEAEADAHRRFGDIEAVKRQMRMARLSSLSRGQAAAVLGGIAGCIAVLGITALVYSQRDSEMTASDPGLTRPVLIKHQNPAYTEAALRKKIRGAVWLQCIVQTTGVCTDFRITKPLDPGGLDQQALMAVRDWRFQPGTRHGRPVPVSVTVEMQFRLRD